MKSSCFHTHYDTLKVAQDAPDELIRAAYTSLAKKYHPDRNNNSAECQEMMQDINASYEVLSDPEKRREHDAQIQGKKQQGHSREKAQQNWTQEHVDKENARQSSTPGICLYVPSFSLLFLGAILVLLLSGQIAEERTPYYPPPDQKSSLVVRKIQERHGHINSWNTLRVQQFRLVSESLISRGVSLAEALLRAEEKVFHHQSFLTLLAADIAHRANREHLFNDQKEANLLNVISRGGTVGLGYTLSHEQRSYISAEERNIWARRLRTNVPAQCRQLYFTFPEFQYGVTFVYSYFSAKGKRIDSYALHTDACEPHLKKP